MTVLEVQAADWNLPEPHGAQAVHRSPVPKKPSLQAQTATPVVSVHAALASQLADSHGLNEDDEQDAVTTARAAMSNAAQRWSIDRLSIKSRRHARRTRAR